MITSIIKCVMKLLIHSFYTVTVWEWISNSITLYWTCDYLSILGFFNEVLVALIHVDVIKWKHFPRYWPFVRGIHRSPVNSPHKGQWRGASVLSLICAWTNGWVNNRDAGDFRRHCAHFEVIVMLRRHWCYPCRHINVFKTVAVNVICDQWRPTAKEVID